MVEAGNSSRQVVTVGLNRRGATIFQKLAKEVPAGKIGKVTFATACHVSNMSPNGIGKLQPEAPPANFDWDMWLYSKGLSTLSVQHSPLHVPLVGRLRQPNFKQRGTLPRPATLVAERRGTDGDKRPRGELRGRR